jgi:hypothetical protein
MAAPDRELTAVRARLAAAGDEAVARLAARAPSGRTLAYGAPRPYGVAEHAVVELDDGALVWITHGCAWLWLPDLDAAVTIERRPGSADFPDIDIPSAIARLGDHIVVATPCSLHVLSIDNCRAIAAEAVAVWRSGRPLGGGADSWGTIRQRGPLRAIALPDTVSWQSIDEPFAPTRSGFLVRVAPLWK